MYRYINGFVLTLQINFILLNNRYEKIDFQIKVREQFMFLKAADTETLPWFAINANRSIDVIHEEIKIIAEDTLLKCENKPIRRLWS